MSPYMVVGMIGAIKAGCGYVPIDTSVPIERVEMIMNKVNSTFILNTTDSSVNQSKKELTIEDIKHSDYPIVLIVKWLKQMLFILYSLRFYR